MEAIAEKAAEVLPVRAEKPGDFKKGHDPRRSTTPKAPKEYVAPEEDGANSHLMDMRHVYLNPSQFDKTQGHETARKLLRKDPKGFMAQLSAMEKEHRVSLREVREKEEAPAPKSSVGLEDVGTESCLALCEAAIKKYLESKS